MRMSGGHSKANSRTTVRGLRGSCLSKKDVEGDMSPSAEALQYMWPSGQIYAEAESPFEIQRLGNGEIILPVDIERMVFIHDVQIRMPPQSVPVLDVCPA